MVGQAAYKSTIKKTGTTTSFTAEAFTVVSGSSNKKFKINTASKNIWDRDATFTFKEDAVAIASSDIDSIDYLFGVVTFKTAKTGAITADGKYLPTASVVGVNTYSLECAGEILDNTDFATAQGNSGHRTKIMGMQDATFTANRWNDLTKDYSAILAAGNAVVIEIDHGGAGTDVFRGYFILESDNFEGDLSSLEGESFTFQCDSNDDGTAAFGWL